MFRKIQVYAVYLTIRLRARDFYAVMGELSFVLSKRAHLMSTKVLGVEGCWVRAFVHNCLAFGMAIIDNCVY